MKITGNFDVKLTPQETFVKGKNGINLARMSIEKTFHGELQASSQGEMLSAMTATDGSAGYVAIEQVEGVLAGRKGSFVLQHYGRMDKGKDRLTLEVVPDSGTGELVGITGSMSITMADGQHAYEFDYDLA